MPALKNWISIAALCFCLCACKDPEPTGPTREYSSFSIKEVVLVRFPVFSINGWDDGTYMDEDSYADIIYHFDYGLGKYPTIDHSKVYPNVKGGPLVMEPTQHMEKLPIDLAAMKLEIYDYDDPYHELMGWPITFSPIRLTANNTYPSEVTLFDTHHNTPTYGVTFQVKLKLEWHK